MPFRALLFVLHAARVRAAIDYATAVDDCAASEEGSCALSALQHGSHKVTSSEAAAAYFDEQASNSAGRGAAAAVAHLTRDELRWYRHRFIQKAVGLPVEALAKTFQEQRPILTQWLINQVRGSTQTFEMQVPVDASNFELSSSMEWEMRVPEGAGNFSEDDLKQITGELDDGSVEIRKTPMASGHFPAEWDSVDQWPQCKEVFTHVRNQGRCSSCWAQSAAGTMDSRLCIATNGAFSGERAWTSAAYITSCYAPTGMNGCDGGNAALALERMAAGGAPTGSMDQDTCVPYFSSGNFVDVLRSGGEGQKAPACPSSCTAQVAYPRSLVADRFYPTGRVVVSSFLDDMMQALMQHGPMPMAFDVYADFLFLLRGWYDHKSAIFGMKPITRHATLALGWTQRKGEVYVHGVNSWGSFWGDGGQFWMRASCCNLSFYVPESMVPAQQSALPLPPPGGGVKGSCSRDTGGTCWFLGCSGSRGATNCEHRKCICRSDLCALEGKCVTPVA